MDPLAARALARIRDPDGPALADLARMVVELTTETPLRDIATPRWIAGQIAAALEAGTRGDHARAWVDRRIDAERKRWSEETRTLREFVPPEAEEPLRELLGRPYAPDGDLTFRILDQPAIRGLVREVLSTSIRNFRQRISAVEPGVLGDVGRRAAARGKGLFGSVTGNLAGNVRGVAENLVGAVRDEVEHTFDGRIKDYVRGATVDTVRGIAGYVADPAHAPAFAELRLAVLDVILDTPIHELATEGDKLHPEQIVDVVVGALRSAVAADDFVDRTEQRIAQILAEAGDGTFGAWLDEVDLREVWTETTVELVTARLRAVVETDAFEAWWEGLFVDG